jgi:NAD(P)-dependent dehydrogenase (short-subunit alcohol dehydrogenase family)
MGLWATVGALGAGYWAMRRVLARTISLRGQVALITGGSRGLGVLLARELAAEGCKIAICARDAAELYRTRLNLENRGAEVFALPCDVTQRSQVEETIAATVRRFGRLDILVNNAGIIQVGPVETMNIVDFQHAMAVNFWGTVYASLAASEVMKAQGVAGRIVNITSIGGKVAVPHLLPYDSAKFAALGFSEGLRAELATHGISVTTVVPGLMRTGSYTNALFKGQPGQEFGWFSVAANTRLTAMDARRAARKVVRATKLRSAEVVLGWQAKLLSTAKDLFPNTVAAVLAMVNGMLPDAQGSAELPMSRGRALAAMETRRVVDEVGGGGPGGMPEPEPL